MQDSTYGCLDANVVFVDQILPTICCQCFLDIAIGNDHKRNSEDDKDDKYDTDDKDVKARQGAWAGGTGSR